MEDPTDHRLILLRLSKETHHIWTKNSKRFTFEHKWLLEEDFSDFFKKSWEKMNGIGSLSEKLSQCSKVLRGWAGTRFNQLGKKIQIL